MNPLNQTVISLLFVATDVMGQAPPADFPVALDWGGDPTSSSTAYDVAYDATADVWAVAVAAGDDRNGGTIRVARFRSDGTVRGSTMTVATTTGRYHEVKIADVRQTGVFVVAWHESVGTEHSIKARHFHAASGYVRSGEVVFARETGAASTPLRGPDMAGDPSGRDDDATLVWRNSTHIFTCDLGTSTRFGPENVERIAATSTAGAPRIGKALDAQTGAFRQCVVWHDRRWSPVRAAYQQDVYAALISANIGQIGATIVVSSSDLVDDTAPDVDGDGSEFLVSWERGQLSSSTRRDVVCCKLVVAGGQLAVAGPEQRVASSFLRDERAPAVAWLGDKYAITYQRETGQQVTWCGAAGGTSIAPVQRYENKVTCRMARDGSVGGPYFTLDSGLRASGRALAPVVAGVRSGAEGAGDGAVIFWQEQCIEHLGSVDRATFAAFATAFSAFGGGAVVDLGGGCGNGGTLSASGPFAIANPDFGLELTGADPSALLAIVHVADNSAPIGCGPCQLTPATYGSLVLPVVGGGLSWRLPLGRSPDWLGVEIVWHVGVIAIGGGPCPFYPDIAMSNRLLTTYGW